MFNETDLEKILTDEDVQKVPYCYKYIMIHAIEKYLEEKEKNNATVPDFPELL